MAEGSMIKKIAVIGPESTGKSMLCDLLATHYKTNWAREFARDYLIEKNNEYGFEDLHSILLGQVKNEDDLISSVHNSTGKTAPLFLDTDPYVIKVWSEFVFNKCDNRILKAIASRKYDFYLLCDVDLPWMPDPLREHPDLYTRTKLFHYYKDAMVQQHVPWVIISGNYDLRLKIAIENVDEILKA